ncbi:MAG: hypothetical protein RLZZ303_2162 [Candidatus Hydrogenedentota bacterium]
MPRCALLACDDLTGYVVDDDLLLAPFEQAGWQAEFVSWSAPNVDWSGYDAAIIRATWDYTKRLEDFLRALHDLSESGLPLYNGLETVVWNAHKRYLLELSEKGVPIVPTRPSSNIDEAALHECIERFNVGELIIKPMVSAGAYKTHRFTRDQLPELLPRLRAELDGVDHMVQPFLTSLLDVGEYSLFYFNGTLSHTIVKRPTPGDFRVQEEHGGIIEPAESNPEQRRVAELALAALPEDCLYARVDLVAADDGGWQVIEVELIEPSLYLRMDDGAPARFVQAFLETHTQRRSLA